MSSLLPFSTREFLETQSNMSNLSNPRYSPYSPAPDDGNSNVANSPWSEQSGYDSFTLPPIHNYDDLFDNSQYFDALPRLPSPSPFLPEPPQSQNDQPPPSNQHARRRTQPVSQYRLAGSESPDPFEEFVDLPSPRSPVAMPNSRNTTRSSSVVDLTASSPPKRNEAPSSRKRKAETPGEGRASKVARPGSSSSTSTGQQSLDNIAVVDLVNVNDYATYEAMRAKEQAELIKAQNEAEANKPVKLAAFECIICMSNPTDLTVTHCGMYSLDCCR